VKRKTKNKTNRPSGVVAFDVLNLTTQRNVAEEKNLDKLQFDYIPFGENDQNDFPHHLADLKRKSSTHRSILAQKVIYTVGNGFLTENEPLLQYLTQSNANGNTFMSVWSNIIDDYYTFGNAYYEIVTYDGGVNIYHIDATKVRIAKDKENVIVHPDWTEYNQRKELAVVIPFYPAFVKEGGNKRSVIHIKDYEPEFDYYGLPDYVAALEDISVNYEIGRWNNTKFKNHFQPSSIVEINGDMSDEEAEAFVEEARSKFTAEGNNGKILFLVKNGDTAPATVTTIEDKQDGSFMDLQSITNQNIITAHRWQPSLSGVISSGKMSSQGNEIRIAYEMIMATVVTKTKHLLFDPIKAVLNDNGFDVTDLEVEYKPPISFMSDVVVTDVLEINELREALGFERKDGYDKLVNKKEVEDEVVVDGQQEELKNIDNK
tara:strand:+ start:6701 stop:7993 length:1293 start_codon:yes stop_codon:yes gene_type:complete